MTRRVCDIMVCDAMVRKLVPTARAEMVCRLVNQMGVPQTEVARRLGISRAAISQYVAHKRGCCGNPDFSPELSSMIDRWALSVMGEEGEGITLCDLCRSAAKKF
ncbi:MAG: transcriptional regulator [Methanospirillum sp.]|nr:transcriptional regulator [Methanospirillum sp.]